MQFRDLQGDELMPRSSGNVNFNLKRIADRAFRYWYIVAVSLVIGVAIAFVYNRYASRVYTVSASIIVREGNENAAAEFLYKSNPLVNPYRNYFNELYIMRSYPLLQQVVEQLNFDVSWYRDGSVKTTEVYGDELPVQIKVFTGLSSPYGKQAWFECTGPNSYNLELTDNGDINGKLYRGLSFGDTVSMDGYKLLAKVRPIGQNLEKGKRYRIVFQDPYNIAKLYSNKLIATWAEVGSSVINLKVNGNTPQKERDFLSKFIERYQQYDVEKKNQVASKSIEFLDRQLQHIGDSLNYFDDRIEGFKRVNRYSDVAGQSVRLLARIEELETQRTQLVLQESYFQYLENYIHNGKDIDQVVPPTALGITDNILTTLVGQLTEQQFSLRMLGALQTDGNPLVEERRIKIQQIRKDILEGVNSIRATHRISLELIRKQIQDSEKSLSSLPEAERQLVDIKRSYNVRENLYIFLMQKRAEAGISRASTTTDIIIVNPPNQTGGPITPKPLLNYGIGILSGLLLPLLIFALVDVLNDKVQSREEIEQIIALPVIGGIGHNPIKESGLAVFQKPKSVLAESFRALRSNLNYFTSSHERKIILITSSISGEGKTFTTINLATVIAFSGKKVLIVGADMRRPKIFDDFRLSNDKGLSTFLSGIDTLETCVQRTHIDNLDILSSGPIPPNPSELLLLPRLGEMISMVIKQYDYVLFDTPPLGLVSDVFALSPFAHHTIFMVRQNFTPRHFLHDLNELCEKRNMNSMSILFNDIKKTGPGYGYGYGYGFAYEQKRLGIFGKKNKVDSYYSL